MSISHIKRLATSGFAEPVFNATQENMVTDTQSAEYRTIYTYSRLYKFRLT